jgi:hypothetical protein
MAVRSSIVGGFPGPNFFVELSNRDAILPGTYIIEQGALVAVSSKTIDNLSLSATAKALVTTALTATIAPITISATGNVAISASLSVTIADFIMSATVAVIVSASLDAILNPITVAVTGAVEATIPPVAYGGGPALYPWWWPAYCRRIEAEKEAKRLALAVEGHAYAVMPMPFGHATGEHIADPDADVIEAIAAIWPMLIAA